MVDDLFVALGLECLRVEESVSKRNVSYMLEGLRSKVKLYFYK